MCPRFEDRNASYPKWRIAVRGSVGNFEERQETHGTPAHGTQETVGFTAGGVRLLRCCRQEKSQPIGYSGPTPTTQAGSQRGWPRGR
jgi:hypothetical protein